MSKLEINLVMPGMPPSDAAQMRAMLRMGCWFCSGKLNAGGDRKVVCGRCGAGFEWEATADGKNT